MKTHSASRESSRPRARWTRAAAFAVAGALAIVSAALAGGVAHSTVGAGGYDLVSYHTNEKPLRGNGHHVAVHDGVTYLFADEGNRDAFEKNPAKFLPAYGGWCAYGVSVGKKFVGDPEVWEIVDGRLYLNLSNQIKAIWRKDIPGNVKKADATWPKIEKRSPADLS